MADLAPIVLFVYNRPEHTRRTLAALARDPLASQSRLTIYADGPKAPEHEQGVRQTRGVVRAAGGFLSIDVVERATNLGLAKSVIAGVSEACSTHGRVIVLEDDLLVSPTFLTFMNAGLDRYSQDDRIFQVSGYMFPGMAPSGRAIFLPLPTTWGWATWQRAWRHFDGSAANVTLLEADAQLRHRFDLNGSYSYFDMLQQQKRGQVDSWGIRWYLSVFFANGIVLYPDTSLVKNIGGDGSGTHGALPKVFSVQDISQEMQLPKLPDVVEVDVDRMLSIETLLRSMKPTLFGRISTWLRR